MMKIYTAHYKSAPVLIETNKNERGYKIADYTNEDYRLFTKEALANYQEALQGDNKQEALGNFSLDVYSISKDSEDIIPMQLFVNGGEGLIAMDRSNFNKMLTDLNDNPNLDIDNLKTVDINKVAENIQPVQFLEIENRDGTLEKLELSPLGKDVNIQDIPKDDMRHEAVDSTVRDLQSLEDPFIESVASYDVKSINGETYLSFQLENTNILVSESYLKERLEELTNHKDNSPDTGEYVGKSNSLEEEQTPQFVQEYELA